MGLIDLDVGLLAQDSVPADVAVKELRLRYPAAFQAPFNARTASKAEVAAKLREIVRAGDYTTRRNAEINETIAQAGDVRSMNDADYRALCRKIGIR